MWKNQMLRIEVYPEKVFLSLIRRRSSLFGERWNWWSLKRCEGLGSDKGWVVRRGDDTGAMLLRRQAGEREVERRRGRRRRRMRRRGRRRRRRMRRERGKQEKKKKTVKEKEDKAKKEKKKAICQFVETDFCTTGG